MLSYSYIIYLNIRVFIFCFINSTSQRSFPYKSSVLSVANLNLVSIQQCSFEAILYAVHRNKLTYANFIQIYIEKIIFIMKPITHKKTLAILVYTVEMERKPCLHLV